MAEVEKVKYWKRPGRPNPIRCEFSPHEMAVIRQAAAYSGIPIKHFAEAAIFSTARFALATGTPLDALPQVPTNWHLKAEAEEEEEERAVPDDPPEPPDPLEEAWNAILLSKEPPSDQKLSDLELALGASLPVSSTPPIKLDLRPPRPPKEPEVVLPPVDFPSEPPRGEEGVFAGRGAWSLYGVDPVPAEDPDKKHAEVFGDD